MTAVARTLTAVALSSNVRPVLEKVVQVSATDRTKRQAEDAARRHAEVVGR